MIAESLENLGRWPAWPRIGEGFVDALPESVIENRFIAIQKLALRDGDRST
jgi:hypothetical protein